MAISSDNIQSELNNLKSLLYDISANNPFINCNLNSLYIIENKETQNNDILEKIYQKQNYYLKEYGLPTTLFVNSFIKWKPVGKENFYISPLTYCQITLKKNQKISVNYNYDIADEFIVNPIIKDYFSKNFNIELPDYTQKIKEIHQFLSLEFLKNKDFLLLSDSLNQDEKWEIIESEAIGLFNYKKSLLGRDYDFIMNSPNDLINKLLSIDADDEEILESQNLPSVFLDHSQKQTLLKAIHHNYVIQGPPGTGKSHTIVELIKSLLHNNKKVLFVSEKKSALDVVYNRLKKENLSDFVAYLDTLKSEKRSLFSHFQKTVKKISEINNEEDFTFKTDKSIDYFDTYPEKLIKKNERINHLSIHDLLNEIIENGDLNAPNIKTICPPFNEWQKFEPFLLEIEKIALEKWEIKSLSQLKLLWLNPHVLSQENPFSVIEQRMNEFSQLIQEIETFIQKFELEFDWESFRKLCLAGSVMSMVNKNQIAFFDANNKKYTQFNQLSKKFDTLQNKLSQQKEINGIWKEKPTIAELSLWLEELKNPIPKWKIFKKYQSDSFFNKQSKTLSNTSKIELLKEIEKEYEIQKNLDETIIKLKHDLAIHHPETEINNILLLRKKLDSISSNDTVFILNHTSSEELIQGLHKMNVVIDRIVNIKNFLFHSRFQFTIHEVKTLCEDFSKHFASYNFYLPEIKKLISLPESILDFLRKNNQSIHELNHYIYQYYYRESIKFEPILKEISGDGIKTNFLQISKNKQLINKTIIHQIRTRMIENYQNKENLLQTPNSKLKEESKVKKAILKQERKLFFHEINKQKQFLSCNQFISQTQHYSMELFPLWMMNPLSVSENLPLVAEWFDYVIFDESSQIPLEDSVPTLFRAKKVIVVGDSKQMPPSSFFSSSKDSKTLLNQAESVFPSQMLSWHYRSEHPKLIEFSNQVFYDNELNYFPPVSNEIPIEWNYSPTGKFEAGKNLIEAKNIAEKYFELYQKGIKNVGIIAFSKEQEETIRVEINKIKNHASADANEEITISNLENVQGIEKDYILISIGYGYNSEGKFRLHFGPVNHELGANRLNVLFTRAKKKMIVFSSIQASDFKHSDNFGVEVLKRFLVYISEVSSVKSNQIDIDFHKMLGDILEKNKINFSYYKAIHGLCIHCFVQHESKKIVLVNPCLEKNENKDLYTILNVLKERFEDFRVFLSQDYLRDEKRFETELIQFFKP